MRPLWKLNCEWTHICPMMTIECISIQRPSHDRIWANSLALWRQCAPSTSPSLFKIASVNVEEGWCKFHTELLVFRRSICVVIFDQTSMQPSKIAPTFISKYNIRPVETYPHSLVVLNIQLPNRNRISSRRPIVIYCQCRQYIGFSPVCF